MNKSQLVANVATQLKTTKSEAGRVVDAVLGGIQNGLNSDRSVTITGFGTFEVKPRKARIGRNPHSGEPIQIAAGSRIGFRVGRGLKKSL